MNRIFLIIITIFSLTLSMSQTPTFSQTVNKLFFGVDVSDKASSLLDSFLMIPQLLHCDTVARQWNINVAMEMESDKAWSSKHKFLFTESPLSDLQIENGIIEVRIGETDSTKKLLGLNWNLQFDNKVSATKCYEKLKLIFNNLATNKKFEYEKGFGDIAQFSTRNQVDTGIRDITLFLGKSPKTEKYEVALVFGSDFRDD